MNKVHQDMGWQHTYTALLLSGEEGGSASKESTRSTSSKESLTSGNGSRVGEPGQDALASDLSNSFLQTKEAMPVQDQALAPQGSKGSAPDRG
jgi:hypothetical protein